MTFEMIKRTLRGKIMWDDTEETYHLQQKYVDIGLCEPFWEDFEGLNVIITVEVISKEGVE